MGKYRVTKMPDQQIALTGCISVSSEEFGKERKHFRLTNPKTGEKSIVYTGQPTPKHERGQVGLSGVQREALKLAENEDIDIVTFTPDRSLFKIVNLNPSIAVYPRAIEF